MKHGPQDIYPIGGLRNLLRTDCEKFGGIRPWGRAHQISYSHVSRVICGKAEPGPKLLRALGLRASTVYVPAPRKHRAVNEEGTRNG